MGAGWGESGFMALTPTQQETLTALWPLLETTPHRALIVDLILDGEITAEPWPGSHFGVKWRVHTSQGEEGPHRGLTSARESSEKGRG